LWLAGTIAPDFTLDHVATGWQFDRAQKDGNAGGSQSGFNNQFFFTNTNILMGSASLNQQSTADEFSLNDNAPFTSDSHTVNSRQNASLSEGEKTGFRDSVVNENGSTETTVNEHRTAIDDSTIGVTDFNISADLSAPSGKRATAEFEVLNFEKLSFVPFMQLPPVLGHGNQIVESSPLFNAAPGLGQSENQDDQSALQHSLSLGFQTLPPDRDVVNNSEAISSQPSALSFDQLALLNQATITIADLADGYLALTLGTTITLDIDAAGYGWFVDSTPFVNEEFTTREA